MSDIVDPFSLRGRRALITGSSRGIGLAIAQGMARAGSEVILHGRDHEALEAARVSITSTGGVATSLVTDLGDPSGPRALAAGALAGGTIDVLVNNAGVNIAQPLDEIALEDWERVLRLDLTAALLLTQSLVPAMAAIGRGRVINVGSIMSLIARAGIPAYAAAKHGLAGMTKALAAELGPKGITVNMIAPGYVRTGATTGYQSSTAFTEMVERRTPVGRWGQPADITGAVVYLASDAAGYVNGHALVVDGGLTATV